jgi:hypothetical protein
MNALRVSSKAYPSFENTIKRLNLFRKNESRNVFHQFFKKAFEKSTAFAMLTISLVGMAGYGGGSHNPFIYITW